MSFFDKYFLNYNLNLEEFNSFKIISNYSIYNNDLKLITNMIIEDDIGDYYFINDENDKIIDVCRMPYYIQEDWFKYNKKRLNIKIINKHIKANESSDIVNSDIIKLLEFLKMIRRDFIIKGII